MLAYRGLLLSILMPFLLGACSSFGPHSLRQSRLEYNEAVKSTTEEQLLLNIVRLRYSDTPSSLAVSSIAAQFERTQSLGLIPFFTAAGGDINRSFASVMPQAEIVNADRPTFSFTPLDDQEFTRKLFTPLPLDAVVYLCKTTWPVSTVFRLYLENLNWVPNAQTASGPTPPREPQYSDFQRGVAALQVLQERGQMVFGVEERDEAVGGRLPAERIKGSDLVEAAKNGFEYQRDGEGGHWRLMKKIQQPVVRFSPKALESPEFLTVRQVFGLKPGVSKFDITQESLSPFPAESPANQAANGVASFDIETRSMLQTLYFISHGVAVPPAHLSSGLARQTVKATGEPFDWGAVTRGLFAVAYQEGGERPALARVAVPYRGYWFYISEADQETKATFSLLVELSRLELNPKAGNTPVLTLPVGSR